MRVRQLDLCRALLPQSFLALTQLEYSQGKKNYKLRTAEICNLRMQKPSRQIISLNSSTISGVGEGFAEDLSSNYMMKVKPGGVHM